jgi:hypothetical protein
MHRIITAAAILASLSGCATSMVCSPPSPDGYRRCDPVPYAQPAPPVSYVPEPGPGYAPAYPPYEPYRPHYRHQWVTDTPHWNPGDE